MVIGHRVEVKRCPLSGPIWPWLPGSNILLVSSAVQSPPCYTPSLTWGSTHPPVIWYKWFGGFAWIWKNAIQNGWGAAFKNAEPNGKKTWKPQTILTFSKRIWKNLILQVLTVWYFVGMVSVIIGQRFPLLEEKLGIKSTMKSSITPMQSKTWRDNRQVSREPWFQKASEELIIADWENYLWYCRDREIFNQICTLIKSPVKRNESLKKIKTIFFENYHCIR